MSRGGGCELVGSSCLLCGSQSESEANPTSSSTPSTAAILTTAQAITHNEPRYALTCLAPTFIPISYRDQARIEPDAQITIYLQYSGIDLTADAGSEGGDRMRDPWGGEKDKFRAGTREDKKDGECADI